MTSSAADPPAGPSAAEALLRDQAADRLQAHGPTLAAAAVAGLPAFGADEPDLALLGDSLVRLLVDTVRSGRCEARSGALIGLAAFVDRLGLAPPALFSAVYRVTRAVDHLDGDASTRGTGVGTPPADFVRRAAFDLLAAWVTRTLELPTSPSITDGPTTLHTRAMFDTVLAKECQRAERFEHWLSLLLIDVSDLQDINRTRGYGVGEQVLERMGILIRRYFRQHDWVARYGDQAVAVLLPETGPEDAVTLAGLMRTMIRERLAVDDEHQRPVTVTVAAASARPLNGHPVDADRILDELDAALEQAAESDPAAVASVEIHPVVELADDTSLEP